MKNKHNSISRFFLLIIAFSLIANWSNAQTTVSIQPNRVKCIGDTVQIPIHLTGQGILNMAFYLTYDHTLLIPYSTPFTNVHPLMAVTGFNPTWNSTTMGIFVDAMGLSGINFNGDLLLKLVFTVVKSGTTNIDFRVVPMTYPVSRIWDEFGNRITPVSYFGNQISTATILPDPAGSISGPSTVYQGASNVAFSVSPILNANGYQWSLPAGASISGGFNSPSITVNFSPSASSGVITVLGTNSCGNGIPSPPFAITVIPATYISIIAPNGGEEWAQGTIHNITWTDNIAENVKIELYKGGLFLQVITASTPSNGTYSWAIYDVQNAGTDYRVKITSTIDNTVFDVSDADFTISPGVQPNLEVQGITIIGGQSECYNATQSIYIAGNGTIFVVQNGGFATMIAGQKIVYYPGTTVHSGGYMHGSIAPAGPWCGIMAPSIVTVVKDLEQVPSISTESLFKVFPNPTAGNFTIEQLGEKVNENLKIEGYDILGNTLIKTEMGGEKKHEFSLSEFPVGVYFIRVFGCEKPVTIKVIKK